MMSRRAFSGTALSAAVGLASGMNALPSRSQEMDLSNAPPIVKENMERMKANDLEKCYGINAVGKAVGKNDCAEGAHSCAGQATQARDAQSFVLLPAGDCGKIQGSSLKSS